MTFPRLRDTLAACVVLAGSSALAQTPQVPSKTPVVPVKSMPLTPTKQTPTTTPVTPTKQTPTMTPVTPTKQTPTMIPATPPKTMPITPPKGMPPTPQK